MIEQLDALLSAMLAANAVATAALLGPLVFVHVFSRAADIETAAKPNNEYMAPVDGITGAAAVLRGSFLRACDVSVLPAVRQRLQVRGGTR